jgi:hypothetical protein
MLMMKEKIEQFIINSYDLINNPLEYEKVILEYKSVLGLKEGEHHISYLRKYLGDDELFIEKIKPFSYDSIGLSNLVVGSSSSNKVLSFYNSVDPLFNFMCFLLVMYFQNVKNLVDEKWRKEWSLFFFNQFYMEKEQLMFRFERIESVLTNYHLKLIDNSLLNNENLKNIEDLAGILDLVDTINIKYRIINNDKIKSIKNQKLFYKSKLKKYDKLYFVEKEKQNLLDEELKRQEYKKLKPLKELWLAEAKISIEDLLRIGVENKIWDNDCNIITERKSLYTTGKTLLGSLAIALKGFAISYNTDYKIIGKAFCEVFNIKDKENVKEPFKSFSSGNQDSIKQFKRLLKI